MSRTLTVVVGTGRCGSTALSRVLRLHPQVLSLNEFFATFDPEPFPEGTLDGEEFWRLLAAPRPFADRIIRTGPDFPELLYHRGEGRFSAFDGGIPAISLMTLPHLTDEPDVLFDKLEPVVRAGEPRPVADHYRALFDLLGDWLGSHAIVERSGASLGRVPLLRKHFPEARFLHLYRDGPDCAVSMSKHPAFRLFCMRDDPELAEAMRDESVDLARVLARPLPLTAFGRLWSDMIVEGLRNLDGAPCARLSYESLLTDPEAALTGVARYLGVDPVPGWLAAGQRLLGAGRSGQAGELALTDQEGLRNACEPGTAALKECNFPVVTGADRGRQRN